MDFPLINSLYCSWAQIGVTLAIAGAVSFKTSDFSAIDWEQSLTPGEVKGTGPAILGRTAGEYACSGSMTMHYASGIEFMRALGLISPKIGLATFDVVVQYTPLDVLNAFDVHTVKLIGARIAATQVSNGQGTDATMIVMPLSIMRVEMDGLSLI